MKGKIIEDIKGREILDSRGDPTLEVEVILEGGERGVSQVPAGKSKGEYEALELRDGDGRYSGKGVRKAIEILRREIKKKIVGLPVDDQILIDETLRSLDGTERKERLGANTMLGVSVAALKAAANFYRLPLYQYLGGAGKKLLPVPFFNVLNGGEHAPNNLSIQEFLIVPLGAQTFADALRFGVDVYQSLKGILKDKNLLTGVGDEGGFCPNLKSNEEALQLLVEAIDKASYEPGIDIFLALDCAASSKNFYQDGKYHLQPEGERLTAEDLIRLYEDWVGKYPIISIEDGLAEKDWLGWKKLTEALGRKVQLVGDDIFVTNLSLLRKGIKEGVANAILIKPNQIGTVTETLECITAAQRSGYKTLISHRSGETEDTFIAHLAFATNACQIKAGAPCRGERVGKYNELLRLEEATKAEFAGGLFLNLKEDG